MMHTRVPIINSLVLVALLALPNALSAIDLAAGRTIISHEPMQTNWAFRWPDTLPFPLIPWPVHYGVQQTGEIDASFNCYGQFGTGFGTAPITVYPGWPIDVNFESPSNTDRQYMFAGAIWLGGVIGGDTLVSVGGDGWQPVYELSPPGRSAGIGSVTSMTSRADFSMRAEFVDTFPSSSWEGPHRPLHLTCANRCYAWNSQPYSRTILYDLVITNIGDQLIHDGYIGFFMDGDAYEATSGSQSSYYDDVAGFLPSAATAYIIDNDGDPLSGGYDNPYSVTRAFAFRVVYTSFPATVLSFNWWKSNGIPYLDFGPQTRAAFRDLGTGGLGTPEGDRNKYAFLRNGEIDYDQVFTAAIGPDDPIWMDPPAGEAMNLSRGADARFLLAIGPFDLPPDSSMRVLYATFTGDSIHVDPYNCRDFLTNNYLPSLYWGNLRFDDLLANAARSDSLAESLLIATDPVVGLGAQSQWADSVVISWDPWVFPEVVGYNVYLTELDASTFPRPGVVPPWVVVTPGAQVAELGRSTRYTVSGLDPDKYYAVNVANRTSGIVGEPGKPLLLPSGLIRPAAPLPTSRFAFAPPGERAQFSWSPPVGMAVDHYHVYRCADTAEAKDLFHPFYDNGYAKVVQGVTPADSFTVDGTVYYFYETVPYAEVDGGTMSFDDAATVEGTTYVIAAVDAKGYESQFSTPVTLEIPEARTKEILLLTNSTPSPSTGLVRKDTIYAFYRSILQGHQYDVYSYNDTVYLNCLGTPSSCFDWHLLSRYRLIIIDDEMKDIIPLASIEDTGAQLTKYLLSGGRLAYFGSFRGFHSANVLTTPAAYYGMAHPYLQQFFGIDSVFDVGAAYYYINATPPYVDTAFGFRRAEAESGVLPTIEYDTTRYPFYVTVQNYWPVGTPPSVSVFKLNDSGTVTHRYRSIYPSSSWLEGRPVGVTSTINGTTSYAFGFHLWYMERSAAAALIDSLAGPGCCLGVVGNWDGDAAEIVDISDLMAAVDYLFFSADLRGCFGEADVDLSGSIDISDLQGVVDYLFFEALLPACR